MSEPGRTRHDFPSRKYRHRYVIPSDVIMDEPVLVAGAVHRFVIGRDALPQLIPEAEGQSTLRDPFAQLVLFSGTAAPVSLRAVLEALDRRNADPAGLPQQRSFVVADGGQIPWTEATDDLQRNFRVVIARQGATAAEPDLLISASTNLDSPDAFLQVIAWDASAGAYQFYDRRAGAWIWAGSSWDALAPESRGYGPFDSHVNGALNMKELKMPWLHWHSQAAVISDDALAPGDPLRNEPIWRRRQAADEFERTVARPGIRRWTESRFGRRAQSGVLTGLPECFRQVLGTSTVNLVSSATSYASVVAGADVTLPITFLINADALLDTIGLSPAIGAPVVTSSVYRAVLAQFAVGLTDGTHRLDGDTHFVFVVPEAAFEDVLVLEMLMSEGILSEQLAAALLMVDFANPVFSRRREALLAYVPADARVGEPDAFAAAFVAAVQASPLAAIPGSAEHEFLANWALPHPQWRTEYERRIEQFMDAIAARVATAADFAPLFQLAESRRREFRRRPLAEFRLTTPVTNISEHAPLLEIDPGGRVQPKTGGHMPLTRFDAPGHLTDWNDEAAAKWSEWIGAQLDGARENDGSGAGVVHYGPRPQFFNPLRTPPGPDAVTKDIEWAAFPRIVQLRSVSDRQRWRTADSSRDVQDEYCEWSVTRDPATDKIVRVTFTSEGPEYWQFLASVAPARILELYRKHVSPEVKQSDLFDQGRYVSRNRWNNSTTGGAMHLIQRNNTLTAEIELAAAATLVRRRNQALITEAQQLIACGRYGQAERHSDPHIGAVVNELARAKADLTLANPIGLYIAGLSVAGWVTPDGSDPASYWTITRGTKEKALRAVYEVPVSKTFVVGDIKIAGRAIECGSQIADFIRIKLTGLATRIGASTAPPLEACVEDVPADAAAAVAIRSVAEVLGDQAYSATR